MERDEKPVERQLLDAMGRCWLVTKHTVRRLLTELDIDLTLEQLMILTILDKHNGRNLRFLAESADRERTTITRMVDGLERRNLVIRIPDKTDMRSKLVYLTRAGRDELSRLLTFAPKVFGVIFKGISAEDMTQTAKVLTAMADNQDGDS